MGALDRAIEIGRDRRRYGRQVAGQGRRLIGTMCIYPPVELLTAAGLVPFRITGSPEPITQADRYLEPLMCPFVRSCFDLALQGRFDFLSGMIWPHSCDNVQKTYDIWRHYVPSGFFHYLDVPHMTSPSSLAFFIEEIRNLKGSLEKYTGREIREEDLGQAVEAHNENRALLRRLSGLRKQDPPPITGAEMMEVMLAVTASPVREANEMLGQILSRLEEQQGSRDLRGTGTGRPRLLVYGSQLDHTGPLRILEEAGAHVVADDLCMGSKFYLSDVSTRGDLIENLARRYLEEITCPRTFRFCPGGRRQDLDTRFGYVLDLARQYRVDGVVFYILMFCDTFIFDVPDLRDYLQEAGFPVLHLEYDYRLSHPEAVRTRVEAFLEMIGRKDDRKG